MRWPLATPAACTLIAACVMNLPTGRAADEPDKGADNSIVLTCVRSDANELVEVQFRDVFIVAKELSFMHADGSKTTVHAKNGLVELENGTSTMSGKRIASCCPDGIFSRSGPAILKGTVEQVLKSATKVRGK